MNPWPIEIRKAGNPIYHDRWCLSRGSNYLLRDGSWGWTGEPDDLDTYATREEAEEKLASLLLLEAAQT